MRWGIGAGNNVSLGRSITFLKGKIWKNWGGASNCNFTKDTLLENSFQNAPR